MSLSPTASILLASAVALVAWWASTGAILWLVRAGDRYAKTTVIGATVVGLAAMVGLAYAARVQSLAGVYLGFGSALAVWGWHELLFLTGRVTGPRRVPCPPETRGWRRFVLSTQTVIHHEIALAVTAVLALALTWNQANPTGALTFLVLFALRLSSKLNIFLGVPNPPVALLPEPIRYLAGYFRRAPMNALMPVSLIAALALTILPAAVALNPSFALSARVGGALLATLSLLGLIEHLFLMLTSPDRALWGWALDRKPIPRAPVLATTGDPEP
jgi:putative photosynthetic complex assembly protein 2